MKNKTRFIFLIVLLLVNILFFMFSQKRSELSFDEDRFVLADTAGVNQVKLVHDASEIVLKEQNGDWVLNENYLADESLVKVLFSIMNRVQVKRPADVPVGEEAIQVSFLGDESSQIQVWGNPTKTKTYFSAVGDEGVFEVTIPGYNEYVGGIFELEPDQWRDRMIFNESWRTIQNLTLDYQQSGKKDVNIQFSDDFYVLDRVQQIDSSAVVDYLNQFQFFEANELISEGRFPRYDSLSETTPLARLDIESIQSDDPIRLRIYPRIGQEPFHLVIDESGEMMAIDVNRIQNMLKTPEFFRYKE